MRGENQPRLQALQHPRHLPAGMPLAWAGHRPGRPRAAPPSAPGIPRPIQFRLGAAPHNMGWPPRSGSSPGSSSSGTSTRGLPLRLAEFLAGFPNGSLVTSGAIPVGPLRHHAVEVAELGASREALADAVLPHGSLPEGVSRLFHAAAARRSSARCHFSARVASPPASLGSPAGSPLLLRQGVVGCLDGGEGHVGFRVALLAPRRGAIVDEP